MEQAGMSSIKGRYRGRFYRSYLLYTALETDLLFFAVCDATFLTQVKHLSAEQVSLVTFLSILLSLAVQYPLLKLINRIGNKAAVRAGSVFFLLASILITFSPNFIVLLAGGFLECIGYAFNSIGVAVLKNRLKAEHREDKYVQYQSEANGAASFMMMLSALSCGLLFRINNYFPMYACILLCLAGVAVSFILTASETGSGEIKPASGIKEAEGGQKKAWRIYGALIVISFALFSTVTGTGLAYARLNFHELLDDRTSESVVMLISMTASCIYFFRLLSNLVLQKVYLKVRNRTMLIVSALLLIGLWLQFLPWVSETKNTALMLCAGYLLMAFVRDPFTTIIQNLSLTSSEVQRQQKMLVALNAARKAGSLTLSALATLLLKHTDLSAIMMLMVAATAVNLLIELVILRRSAVPVNLQNDHGAST